MPRTSWEKLGELRLVFPPLAEQRAIADFLDRETARIDAIIEKKRRVVELVAARVASVLDEVIGGARGDIVPLRRVVSQFVDYRGATPEKATQGVPLVTATNVSDGHIDFSQWASSLSVRTHT